MLAKLKSLNGLQDVASDQRTGSPQLMIDIDRDAASRLGVNVTTIEQTLYDAFSQAFVTQLYAPLKTYPQYQQDVSALSRLYVHGAAGKMIPISQFAALKPMPGIISVNHQGQFPAVALSFNLSAWQCRSDATTSNVYVGRCEAELGGLRRVVRRGCCPLRPQGTKGPQGISVHWRTRHEGLPATRNPHIC